MDKTIVNYVISISHPLSGLFMEGGKKDSFYDTYNPREANNLYFNLMDQFEQIQAYNKNFFSGIAIKSALAVAVIIGGSAIFGFVWNYVDVKERTVVFDDAKKIGNWEFPDGNYVFQSAYRMKIFDDNLYNVEIVDKKSGNEIYLLEMSKDFADKYLKYDSKKGEEEKNSDELFLDLYKLDNYGEKAAGMIEDGKAEVSYNLIENKGYETLDEKVKGFLGRMNCADKVVIILAVNKEEKYDNARVYEFVRTLICDEDVGKNRENKIPKNDEVKVDDTENTAPGADSDEDGLINNVEYKISTDPNRADTDGDGFSDFDEIRTGYNPRMPSPGDKLPSEDFEKIKEDIKNIDEENYNKLFGFN